MSEEYIWQGRHCDLKASERAVIFGFWDKKRRLYPQTVFFLELMAFYGWRTFYNNIFRLSTTRELRIDSMGGQDLTDIKTYGQLILHVYRCTHDRQTLRSFKNNLLI